MINLQYIDHIVLRVKSLGTMLDFYQDILGCDIERHRDDIGLYQLRAGRCLIDLVPVDKPIGQRGGAAPGAKGRNLDHFCFRVEPFDPELIQAFLTEKKVQYSPAEVRYGADGNGLSIYISDPEGNVIELKGPPSGNH
ncbi:VOC family protein [Microbulbifer sp. OS29]|uniref:VOC family protein n=1 Tax=Microbulbifer okhotskensis TaxID=2926617 RepID=A0A9X2EQQ0_9GAMM|nr:VOC family protein [Microbulbifer okhotskensis]MCO1335600.1 VOC family protein [Microbulbifer okhotskensis]